MRGFNHVQIVRGRPHPIGSRAVVRMGKDRYLIYLPVSLNFLWRELHEKKVKVRVYIEIPDEEHSKEVY